MFTNLEV